MCVSKCLFGWSCRLSVYVTETDRVMVVCDEVISAPEEGHVIIRVYKWKVSLFGRKHVEKAG